MKQLIFALCAGYLLIVPALLQANERPDHYKGKPSDTLEQAVANFSESNRKLQALLKAELTPTAMVEIHELTYTLEVALEKIHSETAKLKDTLEEVHLASERMDTATAKSRAEAYLKAAQAIVK